MRLAVREDATEFYGEFENSEAVISEKNKIKLFCTIYDALYSDKIGSPMREIVTNAYEVSPDHIDIHLPNLWEPNFSVRDYGPGLPHDFMMKRFLGLGDSTKDHTNEAIGGLGYGCKSPLAAVHQYTVTSFYDGMKSVYVITFDRVSVPNISCTYREETDEPTGLLVSWEAPKAQHEDYRRKLESLVKRMPTLPNVEGNRQYNGQHMAYTMQGDGWAKREVNSLYDMHDSCAVMGIIAYPIESKYISDMTDTQAAILKLGLDITFPIGSLDIAHSREGLGYDDVTVKRIKRKLDKIADELTKRIEQEFASCSTYWEACVKKQEYLRRMGHDMSYRNLIDKLATFNGKKVEAGLSLSYTEVGSGTEFAVIDRSYRDLKQPNLNSRLVSHVRFKVGTVDGVVLVDETQGAGRKLAECTEFNNPLAVKGTQDSFDKVLTLLGNPPYKYVSELPKPAPRQSTKTNTAQFKKFRGWHWSQSRDRLGIERKVFDWNDTSITITDGGYYVPLFGSNPCLDKQEESGPMMGAENFKELIDTLKDNGILPRITQVYGVPATHKKLLDKKEFKDNWTNIFTLAKEEFDKLDRSAERKRQSQKMSNKFAIRSVFRDKPHVEQAAQHLKRSRHELPSSSVVHQVLHLYDSAYEKVDSNKDDLWRNLGRLLHKDCDRPKPNIGDAEQVLDKFRDRYPLFNYMHWRHGVTPHAIQYIKMIDGVDNHSAKTTSTVSA